MAVLVIDAGGFVKARSLCRINLAADNGLDADAFAGFIEFHDAIHDAVVGNGKRIHAALFTGGCKLFDPTGAVQKAVFGMDVEMNESGLQSVHFTF